MQIAYSRQLLMEAISNVEAKDFDELAFKVFRYQVDNNPLYAKFVSLLSIDIEQVKTVSEIPFLPISLFKQYKIQSAEWEAETVFTSSGTTGQIPSRHYLRSGSWYKKISRFGFEQAYGAPSGFCFLALLPSYLERSGSSLVYMVQHFIEESQYPHSGFFLNDFEKLSSFIQECLEKEIPTILLGVSFALLDFAEAHSVNLQDIIIMETGGMKGRRKEMTRAELHGQLKKAFQVNAIHSEYGMTELLSQAYSKRDGLFHCSPTMKVLTREITDPLTSQSLGKTGAINIIDLANLDTCSFIATDDLGRVYKDGSFEILGRMDSSDIRGCNLMVGEG